MNIILITHSIWPSYGQPFIETSTNTIDEYQEYSCEYSIGLVEDADQEV